MLVVKETSDYITVETLLTLRQRLARDFTVHRCLLGPVYTR